MILKHLRQTLANKFLKDTATLQVSGSLNQASQLFSSIVLAYLLGAHGQGSLAVAVILQGLFYNLVNIGIVPAVVSQMAAASARGMQNKVAGWLALMVKAYALVSLVLVGGGYFLLPWVSVLFFANKVGVEEARRIGMWAWVLTLWIPLDTPRAVAQVAFQSTRRMLFLGQLDNGHELMRMFLVLLGAAVTGSPTGAVVGEVLSRVLASYLAMHMYYNARRDGGPWLPGAGEMLRMVRGVPLIKGLDLGVRVGVIKIATMIVIQVVPRVLLGRYAGMDWVAYFHVAARFMGLPLMLMQGVTRTILPALSEQRGLGDLAAFRRLFLKTSLITGGAITAAIVLALPLVQPLVGLVFPDDYAYPVFVCCVILALGIIPQTFSVAQDPFFILTDRLRQNMIICAWGALVTVPANILLVEANPITGPVWGQVVFRSWVFVHFAYIWWYFHRARAGDGFWASSK